MVSTLKGLNVILKLTRSKISIPFQNQFFIIKIKIMSNYRQIFYQIVFGTKHRKPTIDEAYCKELYQYISGVIKNKNCKLYRINGMEDHISYFLRPSSNSFSVRLYQGYKSCQQWVDEGKW